MTRSKESKEGRQTQRGRKGEGERERGNHFQVYVAGALEWPERQQTENEEGTCMYIESVNQNGALRGSHMMHLLKQGWGGVLFFWNNFAFFFSTRLW